MKKIGLLILSSLLFITACEDLDQVPENIASSDSLTNFNGVLNAAYYYQQAAATPLGVMGDFRADNMLMKEAPYTDFHDFNSNLTTSMGDQFFAPIYRNSYKAILSANTVIEKSADDVQIGEAKFLRALSYFKLVAVFGDVTVNLSSAPSTTDTSILVRQPKADVYNDVIIPDLMQAIAALDNSEISNGRASRLAAQALLGKVYATMGDYPNAEMHLEDAINSAGSAGVNLVSDFADVVLDGNSEIIFATQISTTIDDEYHLLSFLRYFLLVLW